MRPVLVATLLLASNAAMAQKWVDEKGKVYYGTPPPGVAVKPQTMGGGTTSSVGTDGASPRSARGKSGTTGGGAASQQEADFQKRQAARDAREREDLARQHDRDRMRHNSEVMKNNQKVWQERYYPK